MAAASTRREGGVKSRGSPRWPASRNHREFTANSNAFGTPAARRTYVCGMTETYLWVKPKVLGRDYVLLRENAEEGRLTFEGPFSTAATVTAGGVEWTFTRNGIVRPVIAIRRGGESVRLAEARMRAGGICEVTIDGEAYRWRPTALFSGEFGWEDRAGTFVIRYLAAPRMTRTVQADRNLPPDARTLLLFLGGYLLALHYNDVATMTAAVTASTSSY